MAQGAPNLLLLAELALMSEDEQQRVVQQQQPLLTHGYSILVPAQDLSSDPIPQNPVHTSVSLICPTQQGVQSQIWANASPQQATATLSTSTQSQPTPKTAPPAVSLSSSDARATSRETITHGEPPGYRVDGNGDVDMDDMALPHENLDDTNEADLEKARHRQGYEDIASVSSTSIPSVTSQPSIPQAQQTLPVSNGSYNASIPTSSLIAAATSTASQSSVTDENLITHFPGLSVEMNDPQLDNLYQQPVQYRTGSVPSSQTATPQPSDPNAFGILPTGLAATTGKNDDDDEDDPLDPRASMPRGEAPFSTVPRHGERFDFFERLAGYPELTLEVSRCMYPSSLLSLYSISRPFHHTINGHLTHAMKLNARFHAAESARLFPFRWYGPLCVRDPVGRLHTDGKVRLVPGLKWLQMVYHREKAVRDILACLARQGLRMPLGMKTSLKKMWMLMDIGTSKRRVQLMGSEEYWTDVDIYNVQMFIVKLDLRFNNPVDGPADEGLRKLMLGQRGLTPLWQLLRRKRFFSEIEILQCALRYSYKPHPDDVGLPVFGVIPEKQGRGHLEGWGAGRVHLLRPDELVVREAVRRNLQLEHHIVPMMLWGYVDYATRSNIEVTDEEEYMSDDGEFVEFDDDIADEMDMREIAQLPPDFIPNLQEAIRRNDQRLQAETEARL